MIAAVLWALGLAFLLGIVAIVAYGVGMADAESQPCPHPAEWLRFDRVFPLDSTRTLLNGGDAICLRCARPVAIQIGHELGEHFGYSLRGGALPPSRKRA